MGNKFLWNKKGSFLDPLMIIIFLFVFGLVVVVSLMIIDEINSRVDFQSPTSDYAISQARTTILSFDSLFMFILIGLIIATMIGAFMIDANPILFWVSFILLLLFLFIAATLSNAFEEVVETGKLEAASTNFPLINKTVDHLGLVTLITFSLVSIALFAKWRSA